LLSGVLEDTHKDDGSMAGRELGLLGIPLPINKESSIMDL
jgi:hypothetical protein